NQIVVVGKTEGLRQGSLIVAGVVLDPNTRAVRELLGSNEVLASKLEAIDAQLAGCLIDEALDVQHGLRSPRAAIWSGGNRVREHADDLDANVLDLVAAG